MKNKIKSYYQIMTICGILAGLLLLIWPTKTMAMVCFILGGLLCLFGVIRILIYFLKKDFSEFFKYDLVLGIIAICGGIFFILKYEIILSFFPFILSIIVVITSLFKLQNALDLLRHKQKGWWSILIFALLGIGLGVFMFCYKFETAITLARFIGTVLVINSVTDAFSLIFINRKIKNAQKAEVVIEAKGTEIQDTEDVQETEE